MRGLAGRTRRDGLRATLPGLEHVPDRLAAVILIRPALHLRGREPLAQQVGLLLAVGLPCKAGSSDCCMAEGALVALIGNGSSAIGAGLLYTRSAGLWSVPPSWSGAVAGARIYVFMRRFRGRCS